MGYAIRSDQYRYVEWYNWNKEEKKADILLCRELFDHMADPQVNMNIAENPKYIDLVESLSLQLKKGWRYAKPIN